MSEIIGTVFEEDALTDLTRELLEDEETAYAYLLENWLASTVGKLREARREAGLTQEEVAERLGTKQPAIARLERDHEGRFSLRRFAEYALACGVLPLDIVFESSEDIREYALENPDKPITAETAYEGWLSGSIIEYDTTRKHESGHALDLWHSMGTLSSNDCVFSDCLRGDSYSQKSPKEQWHASYVFRESGISSRGKYENSSRSRNMCRLGSQKTSDKQEFEVAS